MDGDRHVTGRTLAKHLGQWRTANSRAAYAELAERVKLLVLDGRLPVRTRLPAERELAAALQISRTTVAAGYDLLREAGFLQSKRGSGSWTTLPDAPGVRQLTPFAPAGDSAAFDLAYAALAAPPDALAGAMAAATEQVACHATGSGYQLLGLDSLRETVARRFTDRGLPTTPDQILITCGAQHAMALVLSALVSPGDRVLVEHPTYPNALDAIAREHARAVPVGFTGPDWDLDTIAAAVRDACPRLMYLIPDYQNPTGRCMSQEQRAEIVELARRTRTPLLIDETVSEIVLDGPAPTPLAGQLAESSTSPLITIGSASKTFWGGFRIGWVRARRPMIERIARARASMDISTSVIDQLVCQHLMADLGPVLARRLPAVRSARDHLFALMAQRFPGWRTVVPPGGLSLWVDLGAPVSSALVSSASRHGVMLAAGPRFGLDGAFERYLRLPYTLPEAKLDQAMERLAAAWLALSDAGAPTPGWPDLAAAEVA
ncbi:PLP-dependent aminotransferase family protein [Pseudonocardia acaciae]|uniref:MocR-like transcription factor YczR n=1 Tax=Pseudonocardia acaciae TaxID=551276 RepID=UPI000491600A|nr:PLP-dependent aminotransferase family protein [Pseudonocardia acaciae]